MLQHSIVAKAQDSEAHSFQYNGSVFVCRCLLLRRMIFSINFYNQPFFQTHKIDNIVSDNVLTIELYSQLSS